MHSTMMSCSLVHRCKSRIVFSMLLGLWLAGSSRLVAQMTESGADANGPVHLRISAPSSTRVIPETLLGSFLEPIGHSTYGGLWADVVENPSFENGFMGCKSWFVSLQCRNLIASIASALKFEPRSRIRYCGVLS